MRQGQQNRRGRGRGRKVQNPLSRSYESNGPEVKIRGNASHIAEKYAALARDAQASGDPIMAENYLQHAEHYYRIIMAAQAQAQAQTAAQAGQVGDGANGAGGRRGPSPDEAAATANEANGSAAEARPAEAVAPGKRNGATKKDESSQGDGADKSDKAASDTTAA